MLKNRKNVYLLSFFIPLLIIAGIFIARHIYPFGDECFLRTDLYHQYAPFMNEFMEKIKNGGSLLYSWNIGLGSNFTALYAYYLASPLNWLSFLFPQSLMIEFLSIMLILKTGLCGLTFSYYMTKKFRTADPGICFFAVFYALSAYLAAYSWNVMWLDCLVLAPLILLGLEQLVHENKCFLYCISLGVCIFTNYYISIMVCIFLVVYFIALLIMEPDHSGFFRKCCHFAFFSLLAGALSAILLLPVLSALSLTASGDFSFPKTLTSYFSIIEMLARHFVNVECQEGLEHWPNIYCGVAVLILTPLYVINHKIPLKERIVKVLLLLFMLLGFSMNIPNYIWHGFHYPNSLPARQSFLYIIIVLTMCYEAYRDLKSYSRAQFAGAFWGAVAFILVCQKIITDETFDYKVYYVTLLFVGLYGLLILLFRTGKEKRSLIFFFAACLVVTESAMNMAVTSITTVNRTSYLSNQEDYSALAEEIRTADPELYRIEKDSRKTKNDSALAGYASASLFSSTANAKVTDLYEALGMEGSVNAYSFTGSTPFTSALLGVRYMLSTGDMDTGLYSLVDTEGAASIYECNYSLPIGFMMPSNINLNWNTLTANPAQSINQLATSLSNCGEILVEASDSYASLANFSVTAHQTGYMYIYVTNTSIDDVTAELADGTTRSFSNVKRGYLLDIGKVEDGSTVNLSTSQDTESFTAVAYMLDEDQLSKCISALEDESFVTDSYTDTTVEGHVTAKEDGLLYFSIPDEPGWTVKVDGVVCEKTDFADTMIAVAVSAGEHTVSLSYIPANFQIGAVISAIALLILILLLVFTFLRRRKSSEKQKIEDHKEVFQKELDTDSDGSDFILQELSVEIAESIGNLSEDKDSAATDVQSEKLPDEQVIPEDLDVEDAEPEASAPEEETADAAPVNTADTAEAETAETETAETETANVPEENASAHRRTRKFLHRPGRK